MWEKTSTYGDAIDMLLTIRLPDPAHRQGTQCLAVTYMSAQHKLPKKGCMVVSMTLTALFDALSWPACLVG